MSHMSTPLDDHLCFALYGASMAVSHAYKPVLAAAGITYPQYLVLAALWERDDRSVGELAKRLALEASTITPLAKRLEIAGLVVRRRDPENERRVIASIMPAGRALQSRTSALADRLIGRSGMGADRLISIMRDVRDLRHALAEGALAS